MGNLLLSNFSSFANAAAASTLPASPSFPCRNPSNQLDLKQLEQD
jgi:hypothetical protein